MPAQNHQAFHSAWLCPYPLQVSLSLAGTFAGSTQLLPSQHSDVSPDSGTRTGSDWLLGVFSPDSAPIRAKMLLAATRATLKTEFGPAYVKEEWHCASASDPTAEGERLGRVV